MGSKTSGKFATYPQSGERFGRWEVIAEAPSRRSSSGQKKAFVLCRCACGTVKEVQLANLRSGHSPSCGCEIRQRLGQINRRHGRTRTPVYRIWLGMKQRCTNPALKGFHNWGGRGIKVCERWQVFENFFADMGEPSLGMTLDRIDNDGDYEPGNCRWATRKQQGANSRQTVLITLPDTLRVSLSTACELAGIHTNTIRRYIQRHGVTHQEAFDLIRSKTP